MTRIGQLEGSDFMKMLRLIWAMAMASGFAAMAAPSPIYENYGVVTNVPQVDAVTFVNYGVFSVSSQLPYETQNTLNFTNRGIMQGNPGFRLENVSSTGVRRPANIFFNDLGSTIRGEESFGVIIGGGGFTFFEQSQVLVDAVTNINRGLLTVGANGRVSVRGSSVELARSGLEVRPISDAFNFPGFCFFGGTPFLTETNFVPDPGIYDQYWFITNGIMNVAGNLDLEIDPDTSLVNVLSPQHQVARPSGGFINCYFTNFARLQLNDALAFVSTNQIDETNILIQAVIAANFDPNVNIGARFYPSTSITNPYQTMTLKLGGFESNVVTGEIFENAVYLIDRLTSETNYTLLTNALTGPACPTLMPGNFTLSRGTPCEYLLGELPNSVVTPDLFYQAAFSNQVVTNFYSAYSANIDNILTDLPNIAGVGVTNLPGRIEIEADNLDLRATRMRAEGHISIKTKHLISSANAAIDSQFTSFDLGSTNGTLHIRNMAKDQVQRWAGDISAWSGVWTNLLGTTVTNMVEDPPGSGTMTNVVVTNVITIGFHALLVDGGMNTLQDAFVRHMTLNATNAVVTDNIVLADTLTLNTERLTLDTNTLMVLQGTTLDWNASSAPAVRYFTNHGTLFVQRDAFFGADRPAPYATFVNRGLIDSYATRIRATELEHSGVISAAGGLIIMEADSLKIDGGQLSAWGDLFLHGRDLKFRNNTSEAWTLILNPTNSLSDAGTDGVNIWRVSNGFELSRKPPTGDLLGTEIESSAPQWGNVIHRWAGVNRGATVDGYQDNVALGYLDLSAGFASALTFTGVGGDNALYVDFLELSGSAQTDILNTMIIDPNMVLYFADSNVPVEELDGLFADSGAPEGRLRWVSSFAGPNSSVDVLLSDGRVIQVNRALRESLLIDSDGDGIPNGLDDAPFDNLVVTEVQVVGEPVPGTVAISWKAAAGAAYTVEYLDGVADAGWQALTVKANPALEPGILTVLDTSAAESPVQRFYRVRLNP
jgi:hypothetical protein